MEYNAYGLNVKSDFDVKRAREWDCDEDLLVILDDRCVNLKIEGVEMQILSRIQLPKVREIMIRHCKSDLSNIATIHFLGDDGLDSTMMNFEIDYSDKCIEIIDKEFFVEMNIK
ncbi:MAG: hypothetical protein N4A40_08480 [Tissierellales bacterium]|jgi:hypothetical protein|nr:hypothetical protein [Tissierellales bacterium]